MTDALSFAAQTNAPAGGAAVGQVIGATAAAVVLTTALIVLGLGHRSGRIKFLHKIGEFSEWASGLPAWASMPAGLATVSLIGAMFGAYWDMSLHMDNGRDPGPLANPAHYFILAGLFGIFASGWLSIVLPEEKPGPAAVRITRDWYAPVSGILLMACSSFSLIGFPLDDIGHRLYGQDVTLWGPTHLMLIGGAVTMLIGILALIVEGRASMKRKGIRPAAPPILAPLTSHAARAIYACGGLLIGFTVFQGEFQYGVPQFNILFDPVLIALAGTTPLVAVRLLAGRGAAIGAVVFYAVIIGINSLLIGPVLGESTLHFPLYIVSALLVEAVALAARPADAPYRFAAISGFLVATVGTLAAWGWNHVWAPIEWPAHIMPEAIALAVPVAIAGGVLGAFVAGALKLRPEIVGTRNARAGVLASLLTIAAVFGFLLPTHPPSGGKASVTLTETGRGSGPTRFEQATVRFSPANIVDNADWLRTISWQGQGPVRGAPLQRVGEGVYRSTEPIAVGGSWKSAIRFLRGRERAGVSIYAPADPAIPVAGIPATSSFERPLSDERRFLQRERRTDVPNWLFPMAGVVVLTIYSFLLALVGWGLLRLARSGESVERDAESASRAPARSSGRPAAGVA